MVNSERWLSPQTLVEQGEMVLSDGRRIVPPTWQTTDPNAIRMHPDFRMIVLANRPGFPFLGNDFYAVLGDVFSCHVIDNPDLDSEMSLLAQYGPNVPEHVLLPLAKAFQDLRKLADEGTLPYPYSTREAVAVVKHLSVSNACSSTIQCLEFIIRDPPSNLYTWTLQFIDRLIFHSWTNLRILVTS